MKKPANQTTSAVKVNEANTIWPWKWMEQKRTASLRGIRGATGCRVASCLPETTLGCEARADVFVEQEVGERLLLLIIYQGIVSPNGSSSAERSYGGCFTATSTQSRSQGFEYSGAVCERRHWFASDSLRSLIWSCVHPSFHSFILLFLPFRHCFSPLLGPPVWPVCLPLSPSSTWPPEPLFKPRSAFIPHGLQ